MSEGEYGQDWSDPDTTSSITATKTKNSSDSKKDMASIFSTLLSQRHSSTTDPVLARRPALLSAPHEAALDRRAHAILRHEKRAQLARLRVRPEVVGDAAAGERGLRRAATRGVVQLFNAVLRQQQVKDAHREQQRQNSKKQRGGGSMSSDKRSDGVAQPTTTNTAAGSVDFMALLKSGTAKII
jgi:hypothetical protein